jgi:hypothetical protein
MNILIGADPELFVKHQGNIVSGFGLIKGDKKDPFLVDNGAVQVDGMALEFNIDPAKNEAEFVYNINSVMAQLKDMVPEFEVVAQPTAHFSRDYMSAQPKEALELGCDPDFDAWRDGTVNVKPDQDKPMRTGAGHIHIGWCEDEDASCPIHLSSCIAITKQMDAYLGVASVLFDADTERREMYGKAGAFRPKTYGVEYRVLSNFWLSSPELISFVYQTAMLAMDELVKGNRAFECEGMSPQEIIDSSNKEEAIKFLQNINVEVPHVRMH